MTEWWTYRPDDLLLFSARVYWRMFELHNVALWPLHVATLAVGLAIILLLARRPPGHGVWVAFLLAGCWAFVGWSFLWNRYATINWAVAYVAPFFGLQALMLAVCGVTGGLAFDRRGIAGWLSMLIATVGLVVYPFLPPLFGRPWTAAEVFGVAPDPTAIVTLGLLLAMRDRRVSLLFPIPLLWLVLSGLTLRTMGDPQAWIPLSVVGTVVAFLVLRRVVR